MQINTTSSFLSYQLTTEEVAQACKFTELQRALIQNEIAIAAEEKVNLKFDPTNPLEFAQCEAELTGKIGILKYLLDLNSNQQES